MQPIKISLSDYVLSGGGANGESYDHREDPSVMLKLYFPGKIQQPLDEMNLARKVYELGIPTPTCDVLSTIVRAIQDNYDKQF